MRSLRPAPPVAVVVDRLIAGGYAPYVVDGRSVDDKATALDAIRSDLRFPDWVGHNLDALVDALSDLSWLTSDRPVVVVWASADRLEAMVPRERDGLLAALGDAEGRGGPLAAVVLLDGPRLTSDS